MKSLVLITDVTRMQQDRVCVAGYLPGDRCIRPIVPYLGLPETWLYEHETVLICPWNVVELDLLIEKPEPPHTEDVVIDPAYRRYCGTLSLERRYAFLMRTQDPCVEDIFGAILHAEPGRYIMAGEGERSLGTVRVAFIRDIEYAPKNYGWDFRIAFDDQSGASYRLAVTDLAFRLYLDHLRMHEGMSPRQAAFSVLKSLQTKDVFLRIGLARGWAKHPEHCHAQITGVYSFPDYLHRRCFADFIGR